jgi:CheY-like chemotaxis protein
MFQEGVQFNPNELQAGQGSGLGLWISKEIVSLHDGDITVRSRGLGMGTTFVVKLPVLLRDNVLPMNPSLTNPLPAPVLSPTPQSPVAFSAICADAPLHVLVVDDAISNRKLVCRLLQSKGFICHQADNGQECVNMMLAGGHHHSFDLILMDYEMPIMNGPSAARKLREMKSEILIIGLTGNVLPEDKEYFLEHGANAVLTKPVDLNELLECIRVHRSTGSSAV